MDNAMAVAWGRLLADIIAGGRPFKNKNGHTGLRLVGHTSLFQISSGEGYNPQDACGLTAAGKQYLNCSFHSGRLLGCSPYEYRAAKYFRKKT